MNWDAVGAVAELLGAIGVIASLIYVATQIRRNTSAENANAYQSIMNSWHQSTALLLDSSNRATYLKALQHYGDLSEDESLQFHVQASQMLDRFESMLHFKFLGVTDKVHPADQFAPLIKELMGYPGFREFWRGSHYSPAMRAWMEANCPGVVDSDASG